MSLGRVAMLVLILAIGIPAGAIYMALNPELIFDMDGEAASSSLANELGERYEGPIGEGGCEPSGRGPWLCGVEEDPSTGSKAASTSPTTSASADRG